MEKQLKFVGFCMLVVLVLLLAPGSCTNAWATGSVSDQSVRDEAKVQARESREERVENAKVLTCGLQQIAEMFQASQGAWSSYREVADLMIAGGQGRLGSDSTGRLLVYVMQNTIAVDGISGRLDKGQDGRLSAVLAKYELLTWQEISDVCTWFIQAMAIGLNNTRNRMEQELRNLQDLGVSWQFSDLPKVCPNIK